MLANEFIRLPYLSRRAAAGSPRWGKAHKDYLRQFYRRSVARAGAGAGDARFRGACRGGPGVKDHWGIPVARISGQRHPHDHRDCQFHLPRPSSG